MRLRCTRCGHYVHAWIVADPDEYPSVCCRCLTELTFDDGIACEPITPQAGRGGRLDHLMDLFAMEAKIPEVARADLAPGSIIINHTGQYKYRQLRPDAEG